MPWGHSGVPSLFGNMKDQGKKDNKAIKALYSGIGTFLYAISCFFTVFLLMGRIAVVSGDSMEPNLKNGDTVFLSGVLYQPDYGDIIAIGLSGDDVSLIKRVVALPGDEIDINFETHLITVNHRVITEKYKVQGAISVPGDVTFPLRVPQDSVFVLGDNRNDSLDSRFSSVGFIKTDEIAGHVLYRLLPHFERIN